MQRINPKYIQLLNPSNTEKLFELSIGTMPLFPRTPLPTEELRKRILQYRDILKKARRRLAMKYHPDHYNDDNKMKEINDAYDFLMATIHEKNIRHQQPPQQIRVYYQTGNYAYSNSTTTSGIWTGSFV